MSNSPFLNSIRMDMRQKGYALKTEKTYISLSEVQRILQAMEAPFGSLMNIKKRADLTDLRVFYSLVILSLTISVLCVFFTQLLGCCHHVLQCGFGFWPAAGF